MFQHDFPFFVELSCLNTFDDVVAQHKVGEFEGRDATLRGMTDQQWSEMKDEMKDMSRNAKGFFQSWCSEGADFLKQFRR